MEVDAPFSSLTDDIEWLDDITQPLVSPSSSSSAAAATAAAPSASATSAASAAQPTTPPPLFGNSKIKEFYQYAIEATFADAACLPGVNKQKLYDIYDRWRQLACEALERTSDWPGKQQQSPDHKASSSHMGTRKKSIGMLSNKPQSAASPPTPSASAGAVSFASGAKKPPAYMLPVPTQQQQQQQPADMDSPPPPPTSPAFGPQPAPQTVSPPTKRMLTPTPSPLLTLSPIKPLPSPHMQETPKREFARKWIGSMLEHHRDRLHQLKRRLASPDPTPAGRDLYGYKLDCKSHADTVYALSYTRESNMQRQYEFRVKLTSALIRVGHYEFVASVVHLLLLNN